MISIIICSRNSSDYEAVANNVRNTIGVPFEMVVVDNRTNNHNIFTAYNEGIKRAKGEILCFMHEDILFHTLDWGRIVERHLANEGIGLIGVWGAHYMSNYPVVFWTNPCSGTYIQGSKDSNSKYISFLLRRYESVSGEANELDVAVMDGLWFCGRRSLFDEISFDDKMYNSFHCYDLDICMQSLGVGKRNVVINDVLIEHRSGGNINEMYYDQLKLWYNKWKWNLPVVRGVKMSELPWKGKPLASYYLSKIRLPKMVKNIFRKRIETHRNSSLFRLCYAFINWLFLMKNRF